MHRQTLSVKKSISVLVVSHSNPHGDSPFLRALVLCLGGLTSLAYFDV